MIVRNAEFIQHKDGSTSREIQSCTYRVYTFLWFRWRKLIEVVK